MDQSAADAILFDLPVGEDLHDPRVGSHELTLKGASLVVSKEKKTNGLELKFNGGHDAEGKNFEFTHTVWIPTSEGSPGFKRMFLAGLHDLGVVPNDDKRARWADSQEHLDAYLKYAQSKVGIAYAVRINENDDGRAELKFVRSRA